jgi:hypothetical protein
MKMCSGGGTAGKTRSFDETDTHQGGMFDLEGAAFSNDRNKQLLYFDAEFFLDTRDHGAETLSNRK